MLTQDFFEKIEFYKNKSYQLGLLTSWNTIQSEFIFCLNIQVKNVPKPRKKCVRDKVSEIPQIRIRIIENDDRA